MVPFSFRNMARLLLLLATAVIYTTHAQVERSEFGAPAAKSCDQIRQEASKAFQTSYGSRVPAHLVSAMLKMWVESFLPKRCVKALEVGGPFNPSSHSVHDGPLGTVGGPSTVYTTSIKEEGGVAKQKRSVTSEAREKTPNIRSKRFISDLKSMFPGMSMGMLGGRRGAGQKEVSESAQMMKMMLMFSKMQKKRAMQSVKRNIRVGPKQYSGEKYDFGSGMYGDTYHGKRKRRSVEEVTKIESDLANPDQPLSRKKRFLFGDAPDAPAAGPPMPSFLSVLMGTARDPNTGKKVEFGGDYMKNMMRRSFMSAMPHLAGNTPPGKEPPDVVKNLAPIWYFSRMQQAMRPRPPPMMEGYESYHQMRRASPRSIKPRNRDGYYGDNFHGFGKRKRRSVDNVEEQSETVNKRVKRQSEGGNDVITFGDVSIPTEFFKPPERSEEPRYYSGYGKPDDPRYYHQYGRSHHNNYYHHPQQSYHHQQHYYRQQLHRQKLEQQQQQQKFLQHYRHLYALYLQAVGAKQATVTRNQWTPPATPQVPQVPPPALQPAPGYTPPASAPAHQPQAQTPPHNAFVPPSPAAQTPPHNAYSPFPPQQPQIPMQNQGSFSLPQSSNQYMGQSQAQHHYHHAPPPPPQSFPIDPFIPNPPLPPLALTTPYPSRRRRSADHINMAVVTDFDSSWNTHLHRHRRSDDSDKDKNSYTGNFFFSQPIFPSTFFSSYFPPRYSARSNKIAHRQPGRGGVIYGDRLPWASPWTSSQAKPRPAPAIPKQPVPASSPVSGQLAPPSAPVNQQPLAPPPAQLGYQTPPSTATIGRSPPQSPPRAAAAPVGQLIPPQPTPMGRQPLQLSELFSPAASVNQPLPFSSNSISPSGPFSQPGPLDFQPHTPGISSHRRVKRSDNKDNPDSSPNFMFGLPFLSPFMSPTLAQNHHNKIGYSTGRGGVVYGDQMPWSPTFSRVAPPASLSMLRSSPVSSSLGGPLDQYFTPHAQSWGPRG